MLDLKIRTKLAVATVGAIAFTVSIGITGLVTIDWMSDTVAGSFHHEIEHLDALKEFSERFHTYQADVMSATLLRQVDPVMLNRAQEELLESMRTLKGSMTGDEERSVFVSVERHMTDFFSAAQELQAAVDRRQTASVGPIVSGRMAASVGGIKAGLDALSAISVRDGNAVIQEANSVTDRAQLITIGLVLSMIVAGSVAGIWIVRSITVPIRRVTKSIEAADLQTRFDAERRDEVGDLMRSFNIFTDTIKDTLLRVGEASAAVASAASEISASTEQMAAGAQEQSAQVMEVSAAVEQMSKTILENSRNASVTAETARDAQQAASNGGHVVGEGVNGMRRMVDVFRASADTVRSLGQSSAKIGKIVAVIDDIADQTNLLALNAAIEAARAGEQGRGFAVVADEVRRLAERTTTATKEIAEMIRHIQEDTSSAVSTIERGVRDVDGSMSTADAAGSSLREIESISRQVSDMVMQISSASEQQARTSEQIAKSVEGISSVTQETATGLQQVARTSEDLNRLTENLEALMARFQLSGPGKHEPRRESIGDLAVRANGHVVPRTTSRVTPS
jgi:methyl-accepting chemotaxis protein